MAAGGEFEVASKSWVGGLLLRESIPKPGQLASMSVEDVEWVGDTRRTAGGEP